MQISDFLQSGFCDFRIYSLSELINRLKGPGRAHWTDIPKESGVYITFLPNEIEIHFNREPCKAIHTQVTSIAELKDKWNKINKDVNTDILYIGKADNLKKRVSELVRFGAGRAKNHVGGEWLWQVNNIMHAKIMLIPCPHGKQLAFEKYLLNQFVKEHKILPLANREGGKSKETWCLTSLKQVLTRRS